MVNINDLHPKNWDTFKLNFKTLNILKNNIIYPFF